MVGGEAVSQEGIAHAMLPMPEPDPVNVQVVVEQLTPEPENVNAPGTPLMLETPPEGVEHVPSLLR
jgi:hypothetical protein